MLKQLEKNSLRRLAFEQSERRRPPEREIRWGMEDFFFPEFFNRIPEVTGIGGGERTWL